MWNRWFLLGLVALTCLVCTVPAEAALITSNGDVQVTSNATAVPPVLDIKRMDYSLGRIFTNQIDGAAFAAGSEIRTVVSGTIANMTNGAELNVEVAGDPLIGLAAVRGTILSNVGGIVTAFFTEGRLFMTSDVAGTYDARNPTTWNIAGIFAEWDLKPPEGVTTGYDALFNPIGSSVEKGSNQVNKSRVNSLIDDTQDGVFIFKEDSTDAQNLVPDFGDDFVRNVEVPANTLFPQVAEGLVAEVNQRLEFVDYGFISASGGGFTVADLTVLNTLAAWAFSGAGEDLGIDLGALIPSVDLVSAFASGLGAGGANAETYEPIFPPPGTDVPTGDFRAETGGRLHIASQHIPEPASMLVWSLMGLSFALGAYWRRRRGKAA